MINKHILRNGKEISIKPLNVDHLKEIMSLQLKVVKELTTVSFLQPLEEEEFLYILNGRGFMIGAFHNDELIAFRAMMEPELDEDHLGKEAGLDKSVWSEVLYSEITNVNPEYRGNGLQVLLGVLIMKEEIYKKIIKNRDFKQAFLTTDRNWSKLVTDYFNNFENQLHFLETKGMKTSIFQNDYFFQETDSQYSHGLEHLKRRADYVKFQEEINRPEYQAVLKELEL